MTKKKKKKVLNFLSKSWRYLSTKQRELIKKIITKKIYFDLDKTIATTKVAKEFIFPGKTDFYRTLWNIFAVNIVLFLLLEFKSPGLEIKNKIYFDSIYISDFHFFSPSLVMQYNYCFRNLCFQYKLHHSCSMNPTLGETGKVSAACWDHRRPQGHERGDTSAGPATS